jgi:hypothetical protein
MIGDSISIQTKRQIARVECAPALDVTIGSRDSLLEVRQCERDDPGTTTKLRLRNDKKWSEISSGKRLVKIIYDFVTDLPFPHTIVEGGRIEILDDTMFRGITHERLLADNVYEWATYHAIDDCIRLIEFDFGSIEDGLIGKAKVVLIQNNNELSFNYETQEVTKHIDGKDFSFSNSFVYHRNCLQIVKRHVTVNKKYEVVPFDSEGEKYKSKAVFSVHGMKLTHPLFPNSSVLESSTSSVEDWQLEYPFPILLTVNVCGENDVNLTRNREKIVNDAKWVAFRRQLYAVICDKILENLTTEHDRDVFRTIMQRNETDIQSHFEGISPDKLMHQESRDPKDSEDAIVLVIAKKKEGQ